jgi:cytochrome oxidase assembly protein ShyY1
VVEKREGWGASVAIIGVSLLIAGVFQFTWHVERTRAKAATSAQTSAMLLAPAVSATRQ